MKICGIYRIINTITGDFYIGSSKNIKQRLESHKIPSTWKKHPNNLMYQDMKQYGIDKFSFQILTEVEVDSLKEMEQHFIETLKPTYNRNNAKGLDIVKFKESQKKYQESVKFKESQKKYQKSVKFKEYQKSDKFKEAQKKYQKKYQKSDKFKEAHRKASNEYNNQLCFYNGETLTLNALAIRFRKAGVENPTVEAKKHLVLQLYNKKLDNKEIFGMILYK